MEMKPYWIYILLCENKSYYTGFTNNLLKRYKAHLRGTAKCKYTRSFKPICILQGWQIDGDKAFAMKIERQIKQLSRQDKNKLILNPTLLLIDPRIKCISTSLHAALKTLK